MEGVCGQVDGDRSRATRAARVLIITGGDRDFGRLSRVFRPIAGELSLVQEARVTRDGEFDLVVLNYDALPLHERRCIVDGIGALRMTKLLVVSRGMTHLEYQYFFRAGHLPHLIAKDAAPAEVWVTALKLLRGDIFGLAKYFSWGVDPIQLTINSSSDKHAVLRVTEDFAQRMGFGGRLTTLACTAMDELVTNALFNAPIDASGGKRFAHVPRREPIALEAGEQINVELRCDGRLLGMAVSDPFGSISTDCVFQYLGRCFAPGGAPIDTRAPGSGIGLYSVFTSVSHFIVNIAPRRGTEMIGLIELCSNYREFAARGKSFNVFVGDAS